MTTVTPSVVLHQHGIPMRRAGTWLAVNATWRGGEHFSVHVHPVTGGWVDKVTNETGKFPKLLEKLGVKLDRDVQLDPSARESIERQEREALRQRQVRAESMYNRSYPVGKPLDPAVELHGMNVSQRMFWRSAEERIGAYLEERGAIEAARAAWARWTALPKSPQGKPEACLVWPIRNLETGELIGIQREWGRGHENKRMLGAHKVAESQETGGFVLRGDNSRIFLAEGMMTAAAVWKATGCTTICVFDTAGMQSPPLHALVKAPSGTEIIFAGDRDASGDGEKAARIGAEKVASLGLPTAISLPPRVGEDWADFREDVQDALLANREIIRPRERIHMERGTLHATILDAQEHGVLLRHAGREKILNAGTSPEMACALRASIGQNVRITIRDGQVTSITAKKEIRKTLDLCRA